jgi:hypothetical protein
MGINRDCIRDLQLLVRGNEVPLFREADVDKQVSTCATLLKQVHDHIGEERWRALRTKRRGAANGDSELKFIVSHLIRWSSESVDCYRTVDFITEATYTIIRESAPTHSGWNDAKKALTHEHMVPCEAIFQWITSPGFAVTTESLTELLKHCGFRALVQGKNKQPDSEIQKLDRKWKKELPTPICINNGAPIQLNKHSQEYWPMLRYEAARLTDELIPISERAEALRKKYNEAKSSANPFRQ